MGIALQDWGNQADLDAWPLIEGLDVPQFLVALAVRLRPAVRGSAPPQCTDPRLAPGVALAPPNRWPPVAVAPGSPASDAGTPARPPPVCPSCVGRPRPLAPPAGNFARVGRRQRRRDGRDRALSGSGSGVGEDRRRLLLIPSSARSLCKGQLLCCTMEGASSWAAKEVGPAAD